MRWTRFGSPQPLIGLGFRSSLIRGVLASSVAPAVSGILVQPLRAATACEVDQVRIAALDE
ncbi:hypothetical protein X744_32165 [Mesorhizobium sp. LNJC372A00]|nr:hypothetical protein X744_32165 [Mesorhizobium sp. LNJC372A00]